MGNRDGDLLLDAVGRPRRESDFAVGDLSRGNAERNRIPDVAVACVISWRTSIRVGNSVIDHGNIMEVPHFALSCRSRGRLGGREPAGLAARLATGLSARLGTRLPGGLRCRRICRAKVSGARGYWTVRGLESFSWLRAGRARGRS